MRMNTQKWYLIKMTEIKKKKRIFYCTFINHYNKRLNELNGNGPGLSSLGLRTKSSVSDHKRNENHRNQSTSQIEHRPVDPELEIKHSDYTQAGHKEEIDEDGGEGRFLFLSNPTYKIHTVKYCRRSENTVMTQSPRANTMSIENTNETRKGGCLVSSLNWWRISLRGTIVVSDS